MATAMSGPMTDESVLEVVIDDDDEIIEEVIDDDEVEEIIVEDDDDSYEEEVIDDEPEARPPPRGPRRQSMVDLAKVDMCCLVVKKSKIKVSRDYEHDLGRIVVADEDLGEVMQYKPILREVPALVCKQGDYADFMQNFLECPALHQFGIMDMFCQPMDKDSDMAKEVAEQAKLLYLLGIMEDTSGGVLKTIKQLLTILQTNGLQYNRDGKPHTALAILGSKFAHSCVPNLAYSPQAAPDKAVEFSLLRPVSRGDMLSFSYLTDVLETPTNERRQQLMETKSFWCECDRCKGPDYCRCLPCPECNELVPCTYSGDSKSSEAQWKCPKCPDCGEMESDAMESVERQFAKILEMFSRTVEKTRAFDANMNSEYNSPTNLKEIVQECESELSPTHHLTIKALRLLFTAASKHAYVLIRKRVFRGLPLDELVNNYLRMSLIAGYKLVLAGECIAAGSTECSQDEDELKAPNEPNYDRALPMSHISDNLMSLPIFWWPSISLTMTTRYMPLMKIRLGGLADRIQESIVDKWKDIKCMECGTYWNAFTGSTNPE